MNDEETKQETAPSEAQSKTQEAVKHYLFYLRNKWRRQARDADIRGRLDLARDLNRLADALGKDADGVEKSWEKFQEWKEEFERFTSEEPSEYGYAWNR